MAKYSKMAREKIEEVMHEFKHGELKSGKGGKGGFVKSREQAIAIGISEARHEGLRVPNEKKLNEK
jgi:6-phosphogluconate dehydrogenase (decarboxylating)